MGTKNGYLAVSKKDGIKYYFLLESNRWTPDFMQVSQCDIKPEKIEIDMGQFPDMDPEYHHEGVSIEGDFIE
jgi:hypothetical protein